MCDVQPGQYHLIVLPHIKVERQKKVIVKSTDHTQHCNQTLGEECQIQ